jgi:REP element-mobilizing transposase RayT
MKYRRAKVTGGTYFFTVVTHNRRQFLCEPENIDLLRDAFRYVKSSHPFIATAKAVKTEEEDNRAILNQPQNDGKSIQLRFTPKSGAGN